MGRSGRRGRVNMILKIELESGRLMGRGQVVVLVVVAPHALCQVIET